LNLVLLPINLRNLIFLLNTSSSYYKNAPILTLLQADRKRSMIMKLVRFIITLTNMVQMLNALIFITNKQDSDARRQSTRNTQTCRTLSVWTYIINEYDSDARIRNNSLNYLKLLKWSLTVNWKITVGVGPGQYRQ
jgi:hypothetical protein